MNHATKILFVLALGVRALSAVKRQFALLMGRFLAAGFTTLASAVLLLSVPGAARVQL